jgi:hypothetical protein
VPDPKALQHFAPKGHPVLEFLLASSCCIFLRNPQYGSEKIGGWGGIRTHETLARLPVFKTGAFNHSATHPQDTNASALFLSLFEVFAKHSLQVFGEDFAGSHPVVTLASGQMRLINGSLGVYGHLSFIFLLIEEI